MVDYDKSNLINGECMKKSLNSLFIIFSLILTFGCKGGIDPSLPEEITTGTITGKAVYQNAAESSGITVTLEKTDGLKSLSVVHSIELGVSDFSARSIAGNSTTDSEGSYSFTDIEEGVYTIYASSKDSTEKAVTTNVVVARNQTVTAEDLKLTATGNISGKITLDNSETNSAGFLVSVAGTSYIATTDVDGSFTISCVPAKEGYHIIVTKQMLTYMFTDSVTVTAKETVTIQPKNFTVSDLTAGYTSGNDGTSINWRGSFASGDEIEEPKYLDAYFNTTDGCSYIYDGLKWTLLVKTAEEHEWDSGIFIKEQTCTEDGYKIYTCVKCGLLKGENIPSRGGHTYNENFVCVNCGEVKELTVQEFLSTIGNSVTTITADTSKPGITKSRDGKTVNIYGVKISGEFSYSSKFPISLETADLKGLDTSKVTDMNSMFRNCEKLTTIDISNFNTSNVTDMEMMFYDCSNLTSLNLSSFNTAKVTDMRHMFFGCSNLTSIDLSSFNTSKVLLMCSMFNECKKLTTIDISNFDTSKVTNMSSMFEECKSLTNLDLSNFDTSKVTTMHDMFHDCEKLTNLDISNFDTSNVTTIFSMFRGCKSLTNLDLSSFDTSKVTGMYYMFQNCESLTNLDLSNFDTSKVTRMSSMFQACKSLTNLDLSNFDTSKVTSMSSMFEECKSLTNLDLSSFNTSEATNMSYMFSNCESLTNLDLSNFDTSKVTNMYDMFGMCESLTYLDLSNFDTSQVTDMRHMFGMCESLTNLDLSNFDTSQVTDIGSMFSRCNSLTNLDLSSFNTSEATNMSYMFYNCESLTNLDLSNFDTSKVTNMNSMFSGCKNLESIFTSQLYVTDSLKSSSQMFLNCSKLKGEISYDQYKIDAEYANPTTGYFTLKQ